MFTSVLCTNFYSGHIMDYARILVLHFNPDLAKPYMLNARCPIHRNRYTSHKGSCETIAEACEMFLHYKEKSLDNRPENMDFPPFPQWSVYKSFYRPLVKISEYNIKELIVYGIANRYGDVAWK